MQTNHLSWRTCKKRIVMALYIIVSLGLFTALDSCTREQKKDPQLSTREIRDSLYSLLSEEEKRLPENALASLEVAEGLEATLFASEPQLLNPTNMDIDSRGRVWITEAYNYRPALNPNNPRREKGDRIVILEDTNGDGKADTTKVFYQGTDINAPLGIAVLGEKVFVSCSPNVYVFTDSDGDDIPEKKEILYSGIEGVQHDHAIHAFVFGPDGKLYFNFGNAGERLQDAQGHPIIDKNGLKVVADGHPLRQGMVFRANLDGSGVEVLANNFRNNYEVAVDSYGTLWQSDNDDDGNRGVRINYVMEYGNYGYTDEMTGASWQSYRTNMEPEIPLRHWHLNDPGVVPNLLQTGAGSPTGILVYEGALLPERFRNQIIHADAGPNIVRAYPVTNDGAGYKAEIANILEGTRDQWFRPSDVTIAPDGSLFVADWYDPGVGGHQMGDMNRGRIYRIAPPGTPYVNNQISLESPDLAIEALKNPNLAVRYKAWKAIQNFGDEAIPALEELWRQGENPRFRARALWLLSKTSNGRRYIMEAIKDADPNIRITGLRAARQDGGELTSVLQALVHDPSAQVRREVALSLRYHPPQEAAGLWSELALQHDGKDRWYLEALGIGAHGHWDEYFSAWKAKGGLTANPEAARDIIWRARTDQTLPLLAECITNPEIDSTDRLRYFRAFDFHRENPGLKETTLLKLLDTEGADEKHITELVLNHLRPETVRKNPGAGAALKRTLASEEVIGTQKFVNLVDRYGLRDRNKELLKIAMEYPDSTLGTQAISLALAADGGPLVKKVLDGNATSEVLSLLSALAKVQNTASSQLIIHVLEEDSRTPEVREEAVRSLGWGWGGDEQLLAYVRDGRLPKELEPTAAHVLAASYRQGIRDEAAKYLNMDELSTAQTTRDIDELMKLQGTVGPGKTIAQRLCQTCHMIKGEGKDFGPELSQIGGKLPREAIYESILHPDAGISFGYEGYDLKLKDGSIATGIIFNETDDQVSLRLPGGTQLNYEKDDIVSRKKLQHSLMPSNLDAGFSDQQMADLVEYLYSLK